MNRTLLAISPHLDDAIFSAGGTLAQRAAQGWQVVVATCFTQSVPSPTGFALACQLDKGLLADVDYMALRREEDRAACSAIGADFVHLPLPEAPHRGYESAAALFAHPSASDSIEAPLTTMLEALVGDLQPAFILGPAAIGGHVDHVIVRRALTAIERGPASLLLWADFPYIDRDASAFLPSPASFALEENKLAAEDFARKVAGCHAYASQLEFQFGSARAMADRLLKLDIERFLVR